MPLRARVGWPSLCLVARSGSYTGRREKLLGGDGP